MWLECKGIQKNKNRSEGSQESEKDLAEVFSKLFMRVMMEPCLPMQNSSVWQCPDPIQVAWYDKYQPEKW